MMIEVTMRMAREIPRVVHWRMPRQMGTTISCSCQIMPMATLKLSAYPNPFRGEVNIRLESKSNAPVKAAVYNIKGQLIKALGNSKTLTWNGTDTNNQAVSYGIYFIKAEQDGKSISRKVIRVK